MAELDPSHTGGSLIAASKVNGTTVYDTAGEKLGSVYDVMIDKRSGKADVRHHELWRISRHRR